MLNTTTSTHLDAVATEGGKATVETITTHPPAQLITGIPTMLKADIDAAIARLHLLAEFEHKHHNFLVAAESGYFTNGDRSVYFFADRLEQVRDYFGPNGWRIVSKAYEKTVDGIAIRMEIEQYDESLEVSI